MFLIIVFHHNTYNHVTLSCKAKEYTVEIPQAHNTICFAGWLLTLIHVMFEVFVKIKIGFQDLLQDSTLISLFFSLQKTLQLCTYIPSTEISFSTT